MKEVIIHEDIVKLLSLILKLSLKGGQTNGYDDCQLYHYYLIVTVKNQMKPQSPQYRLIQLRRKSQQIVVPKMLCDLTNKENSQNTTNIETSKSKNSCKKNSHEKAPSLKNTLSLTQNALKCTLKKVQKKEAVQQKTQLSLPKRSKNKKNNSHCKESELRQSFNLEAKMNIILDRAQNNESTQVIRKNYESLFSHNFNTKLQIMQQHIMFWVQRCQSLENMLVMTPKLPQPDQSKVVPWDQSESEISMCSYIVDPSQQIKMKPIKKQLQDLLHLNFEKVEQYRQKQL